MSQTHALASHDGLVTKRFSPGQRDGYRREWTMLAHLHRHAPGLAPEPVHADPDGEAPELTMREVPGTPLVPPLSPAQMDALYAALRRLWSTPARGLLRRRHHPNAAHETARSAFAAAVRPPGRAGEAFDAVCEHLDQPGLDDAPDIIVGHGDPNLANYLWDGREVRIVDFEDSGISDRAFELGCLVEHLSARDQDWLGFLPRFDVEGARLHRSRVLFAALSLYRLLPDESGEQSHPPGSLERQAERVLMLLR